jgi:hypothetical protein
MTLVPPSASNWGLTMHSATPMTSQVRAFNPDATIHKTVNSNIPLDAILDVSLATAASGHGARFQWNLALEGVPLSFTPLLRLQCHACGQCHPSWLFTPLTS